MNYRVHFLLLISLYCYTIQAQTNQPLFCKATLKDGTQISGAIKRIKSKNTPQHFELIKPDQSTLLLSPLNTAFVETADSVVYRSAHITIYQNITRGSELNEREEELPEEADFFMERLVKGNTMNLYTYDAAAKTHFIVEDSTGSLFSLRYVKYVDIALQSFVLRDKPIYRDQLRPYIGPGNQRAVKKLASAKFTGEELVDVVAAINQTSQLSKTATTQTKKRRIVYPFSELGGRMLTARFNGTSPRLNSLHFNNKLFFNAGVGAEFRPGKNELFLADIYASVSPYSYATASQYPNSTGTQVQYKYELNAVPVTVGVIANYTLFTAGQTRLLAGLGYALIITNITKDLFTTTDKNADGSIVKLDQVNLSKATAQYCLNADLRVRKRVTFRVVYYPAQGFSGYNSYNFRTKSLNLGLKILM